MDWPTEYDYSEALQHPRTAFADPELQSGRVECGQGMSKRLPSPRSGNFAVVYRIHTTRGWVALRLFKAKGSDPKRKERYTAIHNHFTAHPLQYLARFQYIDNGIRVGPNRYPVIRMEWVDGVRLDKFVQTNLSAPEKIFGITKQWVEMVGALRQAGIAHGDLQNNNVMVVGEQLRLVDYDGCFVPSLKGEQATEEGHRNYQHPKRSRNDFGPELDNFSAWSIYLSLLATAWQPSLWNRLEGGDECLLLRRRDYEAPHQSDAFRLLMTHPDASVRALTVRLRSFLALAPSAVPPLDHWTEADAAAFKVSAWERAGMWAEERLQAGARLKAANRATRAFFRRLPGLIYAARKPLGRLTLRMLAVTAAITWIAVYWLAKVFWQLLHLLLRALVQLFVVAVQEFGIGKVLLALVIAGLSIGLFFQFRSHIHHPKRSANVVAEAPVIPQGLLGTWSGSVAPANRKGKKVTMRVRIGSKASSSTLGKACQAILDPTETSAQSATFHERFLHETELCKNDTIAFRQRDAGRIEFTKTGPSNWQGELSKSVVPPSGTRFSNSRAAESSVVPIPEPHPTDAAKPAMPSSARLNTKPPAEAGSPPLDSSDWRIDANGVWVLYGEKGICASVTPASAADPHLHVHLGIGLSGTFGANEINQAKLVASDYCRSLHQP